jgi:hypothetical protein
VCPRAQLLHAARELVAHTLELAEVEQPGGGRGAILTPACSGHGRGDVREALGDDRAALSLEPRDLHSQRCPGSTLTL